MLTCIGPFRGRSPANLDKLDDARQLSEALQASCLRVGWYGEMTVTLTIADGVIQRVNAALNQELRKC